MSKILASGFCISRPGQDSVCMCVRVLWKKEEEQRKDVGNVTGWLTLSVKVFRILLGASTHLTNLMGSTKLNQPRN